MTEQNPPITLSFSCGKEALIRVVDKATGGWGHINFSGMYEDPMRLFAD